MSGKTCQVFEFRVARSSTTSYYLMKALKVGKSFRREKWKSLDFDNTKQTKEKRWNPKKQTGNSKKSLSRKFVLP